MDLRFLDVLICAFKWKRDTSEITVIQVLTPKRKKKVQTPARHLALAQFRLIQVNWYNEQIQY